MVQPKVSMVIPCYNKDGYIGDMLDSVLLQSWNNLEIILVNDGSTDGTREIIEQYEPKLAARGWTVSIIDQDNQGLPAAVKRGLMQVTGEYVCFPDCDDLLYPEYVYTLANVLTQFPEVSCAVCDDVRNRWDHGFAPQRKTPENEVLLQNSAQLIPKFILGRILPSVCVIMIRTSLIEELSMIDHFFTNICANQEPQVWLPILIADKRIYHVARPLYRNISRVASIITSQTTADRVHHYAEARRRLIQAVLKANAASAINRDRYCKLADIGRFDLIERRLSRISGAEHIKEENRKEFLAAVNHTGLLPEPLDADAVGSVGFRVAYHAVSNYLMGYAPEQKGTLDMISRTQGRLIAYGAGLVARQILPAFLQCRIVPDFIWDRNAGGDGGFLNLPLAAPDFTSLTKDDTVILFLNGHRDVEHLLKGYDANVIYYQDVLDALATKHFPELAVVKYG